MESYEKTMKTIYVNLLNRLSETKRELRDEKKHIKRSRRVMKTKQSLDENMRTALDLASNVLNLTQDELGDILSPSTKNRNGKGDFSSSEDDEQNSSLSQLLFEFEQHLNASKREKKAHLTHQSGEFIGATASYDDQNQAIVILMSKRLSEVLGLERELANLKSSQKSIN